MNKEFGKVPPQSVELETAVLGAILLEPKAVKKAVDRFKDVKVFYKEDHNTIYDTVQKMYNNGQTIDILTVSEQMKKDGTLDEVGGAYYVSTLCDRVASAGHLEAHLEEVYSSFILRELIRKSNETIEKAYDYQDPQELIDKVSLDASNLRSGLIRNEITPITNIVDDANRKLVSLREGDSDISGMSSGLEQLDKKTYGLNKGQFMVFGARPGAGKSSLACSIAYYTAKMGNSVSFFSLEMTSEEIINRLILIDSELPSDKLKRPKRMDDNDFNSYIQSSENVANLPIIVDETAGLNINDLKSKLIDHKEKFNTDVVIVDYLQLMRSDSRKNGTREEEVANISRTLKEISKSLDVHVLALSQLNRSVEQRGGLKKPQISDTRESGAIEQDVDTLGLIYNPSYYGFDEYEMWDGNVVSSDGLIVLDIAKNRHNSAGEIYLRFKPDSMKFKNYEDNYEPDYKVEHPDVRIETNADLELNKDFEESPF